MNPLLPEPANNLGRNVSFAAKPAAKRDSEDATGFQKALKANTPERQKNTAPKSSSGDNSGPTEGGAPKTAASTPSKQSVAESNSHSQHAEASPGQPIDPVSDAADGQLSVLEPQQIITEGPVAEAGTAVLPVANANANTTSMLQVEQASEVSLTQSGADIPGAVLDVSEGGVNPLIPEHNPTLPTLHTDPEGLTPALASATDLGRDIPAEALAGTGFVGLTNANTPGVTDKPVSNTSQLGLEKPFASLDADLSLTDVGVDKKSLLEKPASVVTNTGIAFSPQPAQLKSNLDWQFANRMATLDSEVALDLPSVSKSSSSATGTAYAAVSAVAAMQINDVAADHRVQIPVNIKFGQPEWAGMVAERTAMIAAQKISFAELQLDPPELGPLQVKVTIQNDQASVNFVSANPAVRDSLEQSAGRLREMLEQQGLDLVDVNVADQSDRQQQNSSDSQPGSRQALNGEDDINTEGTVNLMTVVASGIDHYV